MMAIDGRWMFDSVRLPTLDRREEGAIALMLAAERHHAILRALHAAGAVRVADLAAELDVSEMTVRRDLDTLDAQDLLRKVHGGAVTRHNRGEEPESSVKAGQRQAEKAAIASAAAATIEDGMTVAISAGTTTTALARHLRRRPSINVITNSVSVFHVLTDPVGMDGGSPQVYLCGGVRTPSDALVGPLADTAIRSFRVDATYLGVHGWIQMPASLHPISQRLRRIGHSSTSARG